MKLRGLAAAPALAALLASTAAPSLAIVGSSHISSVDAAFIDDGSHDNTYEAQISKLALANSSDPTILFTAKNVVGDDANFARDIAPDTYGNGYKVAEAMTAAQRATLKTLAGKRNHAFDVAYTNALLAAVPAELATYATEIERGEQQTFVALARQYGLVKRNHLMLARKDQAYLATPAERGELGAM